MADLNQFAISRVLGSRIAPGDEPRFGRLRLLPMVAHSHGPLLSAITPGRLGGKYDGQIKRALDAVAVGFSAERLLADPSMAQAFDRKARELGIVAPPALIRRRLLCLRKSGSRILKTTVKERVPSVEPHNAFAIEYAVVRMARIYGASVDDILCEESLGSEFQSVVESLAPDCSPLACRLAALYLRKTRNLRSLRRHALDRLDPKAVEGRWLELGNVDECRVELLTGVGAAILRVDEAERSLYVSRTDSVAELASTLVSPHLWTCIANHFWHPDTSGIRLKVLSHRDVEEKLNAWELRLIQLMEPIFNMKVTPRAA